MWYWSTRHWYPLVNGFSGFMPPDYEKTAMLMTTFPDDKAIARLRLLGVKYILVHEAFYPSKTYTSLMLGRAEAAGTHPARKVSGLGRLDAVVRAPERPGRNRVQLARNLDPGLEQLLVARRDRGCSRRRCIPRDACLHAA